MSVIEGHAEHVMDAAGGSLEPGLRTAARPARRARASRGGLGEVIARLLGMELKMRQYRLGKAFCDAVVAEAGIEALNEVWRSPEALPTPRRARAPARWLDRAAAPLRPRPEPVEPAPSAVTARGPGLQTGVRVDRLEHP